jgi:hypothetical protein
MEHKDRLSAIETWMLNISQDGGVDRSDDLHIDSIDPEWKPREAWIGGGLLAFQDAVQTRDRLAIPLTVALGLSLIPDDFVWRETVGVSQLQPRLAWTPPSLYLFREGEEPGIDFDQAIRDGLVDSDVVSIAFNLDDIPGFRAGRLLRFRHTGSDEYTHSAFLFG